MGEGSIRRGAGRLGGRGPSVGVPRVRDPSATDRARDGGDRLRALFFERAPSGMAILRLEEGLILEELNATGAELLGLPSEGLRDLPLRDVLPRAPEEMERLVEAAVRTGLSGRLESGFGQPDRLFGVTLFPLRDRRVGAVFADITERRRLEERVEAQRANLRGFMDTAEDYFFVLDRDGTIRDTNRTALVALGYWKGELFGRDFLSLCDPLRREEARRRILERNEGMSLACTVPLIRRDGEPLPVETRATEGLWGGRPVLFCVARDISDRLRAEGQARIYVEEIEAKNGELADAYRKIDEQVRKADQIHRLLLPEELPRLSGVELAVWHQAAERLGGDFYHAVHLPRGLLLYLVDVSGHGLDGALLSVFVREQIHSYLLAHASEEISPRALIAFVADRYVRERFPYEYFVCLQVALVEPDQGRILLSNAGIHALPLLVRPGEDVETLDCLGTPIGTAIEREDMELDELQVPFPPGSTLLLATDGLAEERRGGEFFGFGRVRSILARAAAESPEGVVGVIREEFEAFAGVPRGGDDITLLVVRRTGAEEAEA